MTKRVLTGIQSSGVPHIGNYLGAIRPALEHAKESEGFFFIANYHSLTTTRDRSQMLAQSLDVAATWLALGLDPERTVLWNQSDVPEVCELAWILGCLTSKGMLDKAHAFKDAVAKGKKDVTAGLYTYPVLMAADILAFGTNVVPVGKDQKQHVEMTRDIAQRFNNVFGETLVLPEPYIVENMAVIPGLDGQKMSKSYNNTVELFLPRKKLRKKLMGIKTDSTPVEDPKNPDVCNVFALYKLFSTAEEQADLGDRYRAGGLGYGHAKHELVQVMDRHLAEPRERYEELKANPEEILTVLRHGAERARKVARETLDEVRDRTGLLLSRDIS